MHGSTRVVLVAKLLLLFSSYVSANFHDGDIVPASRRGQFHGVCSYFKACKRAICFIFRILNSQASYNSSRSFSTFISGCICSLGLCGMIFWGGIAQNLQLRARSVKPSSDMPLLISHFVPNCWVRCCAGAGGRILRSVNSAGRNSHSSAKRV
jgi:hypothetical protein